MPIRHELAADGDFVLGGQPASAHIPGEADHAKSSQLCNFLHIGGSRKGDPKHDEVIASAMKRLSPSRGLQRTFNALWMDNDSQGSARQSKPYCHQDCAVERVQSSYTSRRITCAGLDDAGDVLKVRQARFGADEVFSS